MSGSVIMTRGPFRKLLGAAAIPLITLIMLEVAVRIWVRNRIFMILVTGRMIVPKTFPISISPTSWKRGRAVLL